MKENLIKISIITVLASILGACGGGNGTSPINPAGSNVAPTANAGVDQTVAADATVTLDGSASSDSDGTISSYVWTQTAGAAVALSDAKVATPTFDASVADDAGETLEFKLTVTDNDGVSASDNVNIVVAASALTLSAISTSTITNNSFRVSATSNENGTVYYLNQTGATEPLVSSLISTGTQINVVANTSFDIDLTGLNADTKYYTFLVAENSAKQTSKVENVAVTTLAVATTTSYPLNDTGVTLNREIQNGAEQVAEYNYLPLQDAAVGRDADSMLNGDADGHKGFSFTVLSNTGAELTGNTTTHTPNTTDLCVLDNVTGLIWEVKKDDADDATATVFRDKDAGYTWYSEDDATNGGKWGGKDGNSNCVDVSGAVGADTNKVCNSASYIASVNAASLCGKTDWRLPTRSELMSIVANDRVNPAIDTNYFPNTKAGWTLTSQTTPVETEAVWVVEFYNGMGYGANLDADSLNGLDDVAYKGGWDNAIRLVSGSPMPSATLNNIPSSAPDDRYTVNGDGTVTDKRTSLMWKQCSEGLSGSDCATGTAELKTSWYDILGGGSVYPDFASLSGWRVPNARELGSLVEEASVVGINSSVFPNTPTGNVFASATPFPGDLFAFITVHFGSGSHLKSFQTFNGISANGSYVRLVRDAN